MAIVIDTYPVSCARLHVPKTKQRVTLILLIGALLIIFPFNVSQPITLVKV